MTDAIRKRLDPGSTFSDEDVERLLDYAEKKRSGVWQTVMFFYHHNQLLLAMDWLREQGDKRLSKLADVLPRLFEEMTARKPAPTVLINKMEGEVRQTFGNGSNAAVVNF